MSRRHLLRVDDEPNVLKALQGVFRNECRISTTGPAGIREEARHGTISTNAGITTLEKALRVLGAHDNVSANCPSLQNQP